MKLRFVNMINQHNEEKEKLHINSVKSYRETQLFSSNKVQLKQKLSQTPTHRRIPSCGNKKEIPLREKLTSTNTSSKNTINYITNE